MKKSLEIVGMIAIFVLLMIGSFYANRAITRWWSGSDNLEKRVAVLEERVDRLEKNKAIDFGNAIQDLVDGNN